jgi:hypothetical protein
MASRVNVSLHPLQVSRWVAPSCHGASCQRAGVYLMTQYVGQPAGSIVYGSGFTP